ncbi:MAG: DUF2461 domain-containing protein [Candidatus Krumholzibacteriota bacterium]
MSALPKAADHFTPAVFKFMRELEANNNRDWFAANKDRYLSDLKEPALRFIVDFGAPLVKISPHFKADPRPNGGSLFRIYRDIRFSKDKRPYKDHTGLHFRHEAGKSAHTPGFYLHLQPGNCFVGVGLWRPDSPTLKLIRDALVADPGLWKKAVGGKKFRDDFQVSGDSLKRPPKGYDPEHPLIDILKMKDFTAYSSLTQKQVTSPGFLDEFARLCKAGGSLVKFLCEAIGQPY